MPARPKAYYRPDNVAEALRLIQQADTVPLGGGTKLLASAMDAAVVDLQECDLDTIRWSEHQLMVGAMTRLASLEQFLSKEVPAESAAPILKEAIHRSGPNTYRNAATIGGTVAARVPDSELLAVLTVLQASLNILQPEPISVNLARYLRQPFPGLITEIVLPWESGSGGMERVARTPADTPIVAVVAWRAAGDRPRLSATGIDDEVAAVRLLEAEQLLATGGREEAIMNAAEAARARCRHRGDFRGDTAYRQDMAYVLTRRVLQRL